MEITLNFNKKMLDYIKEKFDIKDEADLTDAVWEMIETYMELD